MRAEHVAGQDHGRVIRIVLRQLEALASQKLRVRLVRRLDLFVNGRSLLERCDERLVRLRRVPAAKQRPNGFLNLGRIDRPNYGKHHEVSALELIMYL